MTKEEAKNTILELLYKTKQVIPSQLQPDLPPGKYSGKQPEWYSFEHTVWGMGEKIRQIFVEYKALQKDTDILDEIIKICTNPNAKRGRQSFIMLLGYKHCFTYGDKLITQINDCGVYGHVIYTLLKMRAYNFTKEIKPFLNN